MTAEDVALSPPPALGSRNVRLRHVAHIGVRTRDFAFSINGLTPPADPFRVELRAPDGSTWSWGPDDAAQRVTGSAEDFCMLVTQRRARAEEFRALVARVVQRLRTKLRTTSTRKWRNL